MSKLVDHRPAKAISGRDEITVGMPVWHTHFCDEKPAFRIVTRAPYQFKDGHSYDAIGSSSLDDSWWFEAAYADGVVSDYSCADCSLDGSDYNGNYLFRSEADALEWLAETWPLYSPDRHAFFMDDWGDWNYGDDQSGVHDDW